MMDMDTLFEKYVVNGGPLMFVLVPCSLLMLGAILQGIITLRRGRVIPRWILRAAAEAKGGEARRQLYQKLGRHGSPLARVLRLTLKGGSAEAPPAGRAELESRLEEAIITVSDKMYDLVGLLATIYTVGPLLGLIGTILGLMDTFHSYAGVSSPSVQMLSGGVQKALVTTFWGLSMAIPAFVAGQWIQKKIRTYERDLFPEAAWSVIDALYDWKEPAPETEAEAEPSPAGRPAISAILAAKPIVEAESKA